MVNDVKNLVQNKPMRLDHVSYVTTREQLADTVQRLGSLLGTPFIDGGVHPRFGTRNFTAALRNGQYVEVVCPLEHPAAESTPWGMAVSKKANHGGGWLTWVFSTKDISLVELKFGRNAIEGHRMRPDGTDLKWKQIGVMEISDSKELPFFIQWLSNEHPSQQGLPTASISSITIADVNELADSFFRTEILEALNEVKIYWAKSSDNENESGIRTIEFKTSSGLVEID